LAARRISGRRIARRNRYTLRFETRNPKSLCVEHTRRLHDRRAASARPLLGGAPFAPVMHDQPESLEPP
jgi:hypothetical protein